MSKTVTAIIALAILLTVQAGGQQVVAADTQKSLVIGRIIGTELDYPGMFRDSDIGKAIPDPMVVRGFVVLDNTVNRLARLHPKSDGFFYAEVSSGPGYLARFRKDRPHSREPKYFQILPFEGVGGSIINLGTFTVHQEGKPVETALGGGWRWTVGEYKYFYRYIRTDDHQEVLDILKRKKPGLYEKFSDSEPIDVTLSPSDELDSSEKEFTDHGPW
jgi:hypothetical protein